VITPVHWAAALFIATVLHVTAIAWLHQPHARMDPADVESGIVISLQPAAARQRSRVDALVEPAETGSDVRNTRVQRAADDAAPEARAVALGESTALASPEPAPAPRAEGLPAAPAHAPQSAQLQPMPAPAAPPEISPGPVPVAPASVDVAAVGSESVAPAVAQPPPAAPPTVIDTPATAASVTAAEIRDVPTAALAPPAADTLSPGGAATLPSTAVQAPVMRPMAADSAFDEGIPDAAEASDSSVPALRDPVSISAAATTPEPVAAPQLADAAARDLPPEPDERGRTAVLDLESVQAAPATQSAITPAEEITPTQSLTPAELVTARTVPATPLQARAKQDLAGVTAQYAGLLKGWLKRHMHYPRQAWLDGTQGTAIVRFSIDRRGSVLSARLEHSSGHQILDDEVLQMVRRADPFPVIPPDILGEELAIRVPVRFHIADYGRTRHVPPIELK
jgi:protein TonB